MVNERYPKLRQTTPDGRLALREGLILCFFMRRPHVEISQAVTRALELYLATVGREKLGWYIDMGGDIDPAQHKGWAGSMRPLDTQQWAKVHSELREPSGCLLQLEEHQDQVGGFHFEYHGRSRDDIHLPGFVSAVSFWLPTEYLEQLGPEHVKGLAVAIARELPLSSGYVSLAFNSLTETRPVRQFIHEHCFRYPGLDVHQLSASSMSLGEKVRGAYWLNFYGPTLTNQLGGVGSLRTLLDIPSVSIAEVGPQTVLASLGTWPEAGDVEQERDMRPYRVLSQLLEPYLDEVHPGAPEQLRRWQRRFLED